MEGATRSAVRSAAAASSQRHTAALCNVDIIFATRAYMSGAAALALAGREPHPLEVRAALLLRLAQQLLHLLRDLTNEIELNRINAELMPN